MGSDLRVGVTRVCVMAAQQGVNGTNGLFMEEENPAGPKLKWISTFGVFITARVLNGAILHFVLKFKLNDTPDSYTWNK